MNAKVINISNFKGGTGKTTTTVGTAYELSKLGYRVLVIDFDPQADSTAMLLPKLDLDENITIFEAIHHGDLSLAKYEVKDNLDLIASDLDLTGLGDYLYKMHPQRLNERNSYLSKLIQPLKSEYDYIFIDVPPTVSVMTNNAFASSDYIVLALQTQGASLRATKKLIPEIRQLVESLEIQPRILGVLAVIHSKSSATDKRIMKEAHELFEDAMFKNIVQHRERIKAWGEEGITDNENDHWDRNALEQYRLFGQEIIERINELEE